MAQDPSECMAIQRKRMLMAHVMLVMKTICTISTPEAFIEMQQEDMKVATDDIQRGKMIVRVKDKNGPLYHKTSATY